MLPLALEFPHWLSPVALQIGPFALRWYALAYIAGLVLGWLYLRALAERPRLWGGAAGGHAPFTKDHADDFLLWATLGVILGGRLGYVLFYKPELLADPLSVLRVWEGGMAFHGGVIGVVLAIILFARVNGLPILRLGDAVAAVAPIGMFFGRLANFVNGELWGRPTNVPWAIIFPDAGPEPRHPSQLYQAALEGLLVFAIVSLLVWRFRALSRPGLVAGATLALFGLARILGEQFREPDRFLPDYPFGLSMGMMLSAPLVLVGLAIVAFALRPRPAAA
jgi:phosphatidylglycerol---prolipoprotein diacylglyceryl transferase